MSKIIKESGIGGEIANYYYEYLDVISRNKALESERDHLKAEVTRLSGKTGFFIRCEVQAMEIDALKAELEKVNNDLENCSPSDIVERIKDDRNRWREIAKQAVERLRSIRDCLDHGRMISRMKLEQVLSLFDEAAGK